MREACCSSASPSACAQTTAPWPTAPPPWPPWPPPPSSPPAPVLAPELQFLLEQKFGAESLGLHATTAAPKKATAAVTEIGRSVMSGQDIVKYRSRGRTRAARAACAPRRA